MSAVASHAAPGVQSGSSSTTFRAVIESRKAAGQRVSLDDAIAVIVPVLIDLKERHAKGEVHYVHASAITRGPDGLFRLEPTLAVPPKDPKDKAALAPEVLKSNSPGNARASVFAVGAMLYEAVCGTPVGPGMRRPNDVDPSLPEAFEHLIAKALVADPSHRPDDLGALASAMHHLAPMKSIPPPDADISKLDRDGEFEVDVKLSLMPPSPADGGGPAPPPSTPNPKQVFVGGDVPVIDARGAPKVAANDPTRQLANLKARLESDPRPRYVVNRARMDHGPFNAVELLQQIASHKFAGADILRDELTGAAKAIDEWEEFAPFAQHARMHRDIAKEKREVAQVAASEKKAGAAKFILGGILAVALLGGGIAFLVKKVGTRGDGSDVNDDPSAIDLSGGGSLKGSKKAGAGGGRGGGGGGGGAFIGGRSYEAALASNVQEINMGAKAGPDLTDGQLGAPMRNASFISGCGAPNDMKVTVKVAIQNGRAVGVSVYSSPPNPGVQACVDRHVRGLGWPANAKMDSFVTTY